MASKKNTSYKVSVDNVTESLMPSMNIEDGALCRTEDGLYMGHSGSMVKLYPQESTSTELGWARIDDTEYTSSNTFDLSDGVEVTMPNNSGNVVKSSDSVNFYDSSSQKILGSNNKDTYMVTLSFMAKTSNSNNCHLDWALQGDNQINRVSGSIKFYKGNNTAQNQHVVMQYYTDQDFVDNGVQVKITSEGRDSEIWDIIYFIQKTQSYA